MFMLFAFGVVIALCALLWRVAVYALPVFVAFAVGFSLLSTGAGVGAIVVGLVAGVVSWEVAKRAFDHGSNPIRLIVTALFALPAAYTGFQIVWQISDDAIPSLVWRVVLGLAAGLATGGTALRRLTNVAPR